MASNMTPDAFNKLQKPAMVAELKRLNLKSGGNKPDLISRFKDWFNSSHGPSTGPSADTAGPSADTAGPSAEPSAKTSAGSSIATTIIDPTVPTTVSLLQRLFIKDKTRVSQVILDVINKLKYKPGQSFLRKSANKDLSVLLGPVGLFIDAFLRVLDGMVLTPKASRNLVSVRINMKKQMPKIVADAQLAPFFAAWEIDVIDRSQSPRPDNVEEHQVQMALQASIASAAADAARREDEDEDEDDDLGNFDAAAAAAHAEAEKSRKVILQELDIVNSAVMHRLARWALDFPKPAPADMHWPNSFSQDERKQIKDFIRSYIREKDLWLKDLDAGEQTEAVEEMKDHVDFPLEFARNTAVIQLCFIELRIAKKRYSNTPESSRESSTAPGSRDPSPVKRSISPLKRLMKGLGDRSEDGDDDDDDESGGSASSSPTTVRRGRGAGRGGSVARGGLAGKRKASSAADDDDDDEDAGPVRPKRARTSTSLRTSYTPQDLEDDDNDHDGADAARQVDDDDEEYVG